ncbi:hypothetical protein GS580_27345 [Rhodococcus hoagii]|nr:hypothetical protein [Prescottella equi]
MGDVARDALRFVELSGLARIENAHAARKVLLAGELTLSALERDVALRGGDIRDCGNEAIAEVSTRLGCSHTMASHFCDLGVDLRLRLRSRVQRSWPAISTTPEPGEFIVRRRASAPKRWPFWRTISSDRPCNWRRPHSDARFGS